MQLRPGEQFTVVRQLDDPYDEGVYYVEATIRDARTDEVLDVLRLVDKGSQRFTKSWQVAPDPSGLGRYIDIESLVFTDSGYSSISEQYRRENKVYLIHERVDAPMGNGGGDIDYKRIEKIVKTEKGTKVKEISLKPVLDSLAQLKDMVTGIKIPKQQKIDLSGAISGLKKDLQNELSDGFDGVLSAIGEIPEPDKVDLGPIMQKLEELTLPEFQKQIEELLRKSKDIVGKDIVEMNDNFKKLIEAINNIKFSATYSPNVEEVKIEKEPKEEKNVPVVGRQRFIRSMIKLNAKK